MRDSFSLRTGAAFRMTVRTIFVILNGSEGSQRNPNHDFYNVNTSKNKLIS